MWKPPSWVLPGIDTRRFPKNPEDVYKRTALCNLSALTGVALVLLFAVGELATGLVVPGLIDLGSAAMFAVPVWLNRRTRYRAARVWFLIFTNAYLFYNCAELGRASGVWLGFFGMVGYPLALIGPDSRALRRAMTLLPVFSYAVLELTNFQPIPGIPTMPVPEGYFYACVATAFFMCFVAVRFVYTMQRDYERQLERAVEQLAADQKKILDQQTQLVLSAKMAALGEMAAGVAHEINNPLTAIQLLASQVRMLQSRDEQVGELAERIQRVVNRIARIIDALLRFSREKDPAPLEKVSVTRVIDETLELCMARFRQHAVSVEVEVERSAEPLEVMGNPVLLSQAVLNLLNNAFDAVSNQEERRVQIRVSSGAGEVQIVVSDNGPGVPEALQARVFDPFFTTKPVGTGVGLGLSITKGIVEAQKGSLVLERAEQGAAFAIRLPREPRREGQSGQVSA